MLLFHFLFIFHCISYITDKFYGKIFNALKLLFYPLKHVKFCSSFIYFFAKKLLLLFKQNGNLYFITLRHKQYFT